MASSRNDNYRSAALLRTFSGSLDPAYAAQMDRELADANGVHALGYDGYGAVIASAAVDGLAGAHCTAASRPTSPGNAKASTTQG